MPYERSIVKEALVPAHVSEVWKAWTTAEGIRTFMGQDAKIELRPGGPYEVYFGANGPEGSRGSEGCRVLSYLPERMLSFSWNNPPQFREVRNKKIFVVVELEPQAEQTRVRVTHGGWPDGGQWEETYEYFQPAWEWVLNNLRQRFESGPIDWQEEITPPTPAPPTHYFIAMFTPARKTFLQDGTPEENAKVGEHYMQLVEDRKNGLLVLAGRTLEDFPMGFYVYKADDLDSAISRIKEDAAIKAGVFELQWVKPYGLALIRDESLFGQD